jgi:hypothetical protein
MKLNKRGKRGLLGLALMTPGTVLVLGVIISATIKNYMVGVCFGAIILAAIGFIILINND